MRDDAGTPRVRLAALYVRAIERVGLTPIVIAPFDQPANGDADVANPAGDILDVVDGLVLTGGEDVDPAYYGAAPSPHLKTVSGARDATERALTRAAQARATPVLAICRGIQLLNVALGGTLIQDIPSERPAALDHDPPGDRATRTHPLQIDANTRIAQAMAGTQFDVNSVHHQAVDQVAADLHVTARAPDGIVEGVETPADSPWWVVGVQWHPEEFVDHDHAPDHGLFAAFADVVRATHRSSATMEAASAY